MNGFAPFFRNSIVHNCPFFVDNCLIPVLLHIVDQKFSNEDSVLELFVVLGDAAFARCCSSSLSASSTALAVWLPKKPPPIFASSGQLGEFLLQCKDTKITIYWVSVYYIYSNNLR